MEGCEVDLLKLENSQLRTELSAQKAAYQSVKVERDQLYQDLEDCQDELRKIGQELKLREEMFRELKEEKDFEILSLKQMKKELEQKLSALLEDKSCVNPNDTQDTYILKFPGSLTSDLVITALNEWNGVESLTSLFQDVVAAEKAQHQWKPGSPWNIKWKFVVNLYVSAAPDVSDFLKLFFDDLKTIQKKCEQCGFYLSIVHFNSEILQNKQIKQKDLLKFSSCIIHESNIFICILKDSLHRMGKLDIETGFLNNPNTRNTIFVFLPMSKKNLSEMVKLRERIVKCSSNKNNIFECGYNFHYGIAAVHKELLSILSEYGFFETIQTENNNIIFEKLFLNDSLKVEFEQNSLRQTDAEVYLDSSQLIFNSLNEYIKDTSVIVHTMLFATEPGRGKTTILRLWLNELLQTNQVAVISHFIKFPGSSSACVYAIYKRLVFQMQYFLNEHFQISQFPTKLIDQFLYLFNKLSTISKTFLFIIDNIDYIEKFVEVFTWALKPLPSNIRVIFSLCDENCPNTWSGLPSIPIPTLNNTDCSEFVRGIQNLNNLSILSDDQILYMGMCGQKSPLWCSLATNYILKCEDLDFDSIDNLIDSLGECVGISDLLSYFLENWNKYFSQFAKKVLQLLYWSRNGLAFNELLKESLVFRAPFSVQKTTEKPLDEDYVIVKDIELPCEVAYILYELVQRSIISCRGGLYFIHNLQVQDAMQSILCPDPVCNYMLLYTGPLLNIFSNTSSLMSRKGEELLWILKRAELNKELYYTILNIDFLVYFYASGHAREFLDYWMYLEPGESTLASLYYEDIKNMELEGEQHTKSYFISLYWTVGKIMLGLEYFEEALPILQYSLELCESYLDPDSLKISWIMMDLGKLHFTKGRYESAEGYYREALRIHELVYNEDSPQVIQILKDFKEVVSRMDKQSLVDSVSSRIFAIKQNILTTPSAEVSLVNRVNSLELSISKSRTDSIDRANQLNELGVILAEYSDFKFAEKNMLEALSILETQDNSMLPVLQNLGKLYIANERMDLATVVIEKAYNIVKKIDGNLLQKIKIAEKLAYLYRTQALIDQAIPIQRELLAYLINEYGEEHLTVAEGFNNIAVCYCHLGEFSVALPLLEKAVKLYILNLGETHPIVASAIHNLEVAFEKVEHKQDS